MSKSGKPQHLPPAPAHPTGPTLEQQQLIQAIQQMTDGAGQMQGYTVDTKTHEAQRAENERLKRAEIMKQLASEEQQPELPVGAGPKVQF